jgi:hypothetical protein
LILNNFYSSRFSGLLARHGKQILSAEASS